MKLFKKKILAHKMSWYDVTVRQFQELNKLDLTQIEDQITAAEILLGINADDMKWVEFGKKLKELEFLNEKVPETIIRFTYKLNGRTYTCKPRLDDLSVSQFMDFTELSKTKEINKILGVFLIPEGKEYADYDINQVWDDILDMSIVDAQAILFFFKMQFQVCVKTLGDFSIKMLKKGKIDKEVINTIRMTVEELSNMDSCSI